MAPANARFAFVFLALAGGGMAVMLYCFDPSAHHFYPVCQFHQLTGLNCPGCGSTRALYALLHGRLLTALRDNALVMLGLAGLGLRGGWFALNRWRSRPAGSFFSPRWLWPLLVITLVFGVLRNLPAFAFLSP
jgi:hypothetical protein